MWRHDRSWVENILPTCAALLLAVLAVTSLALRYVTEPIQCAMQDTSQRTAYMKEKCFHQTEILVQSDKFLKYLEQHGSRNADDNPFDTWPKQQTYHQWVPLALGLSAVLFLFPHLLWRVLTGFLWLDAHVLTRTIAATSQRENPKGGHVTLQDCALLVYLGLKGNNWMLSVASVARKLVTCVVVVAQMVLVVVWFQPELSGGRDQGDVEEGRNVTLPASLPAVPLPVDTFLCEVNVTSRWNIQTYFWPCLLPLNQVFAKGVIFLFYFFLVLLILCVFDLLYWAGRLFVPPLRDIAVMRNLSVIEQSEKGSQIRCLQAHFYFFCLTLGMDGTLLLAVTADSCGQLAAVDFTRHLWLVYKESLEAGPAPLPDDPAHLGLGPASQSEPTSNWARLVGGDEAGVMTQSTDMALEEVKEGKFGDDDKTKLC